MTFWTLILVLTALYMLGQLTVETAVETLDLDLTIAPAGSMDGYGRSDWGRDLDEDGDCQYLRTEVLIAESLEPPVLSENGCRVVSGLWIGPFTNETFTDPGELDIDHMVPLANAYRSGAETWTPERRQDFSNDLTPRHLAAVKAGANRSKSDSGPEAWKPPYEPAWCQYARDWREIKRAWDLTATHDEAAALAVMLATCD